MSGNEKREIILSCFKEFKKLGMFPPMYEELMKATGITSTATISYHVGFLVNQGKLCKKNRHYVLPEDADGQG